MLRIPDRRSSSVLPSRSSYWWRLFAIENCPPRSEQVQHLSTEERMECQIRRRYTKYLATSFESCSYKSCKGSFHASKYLFIHHLTWIDGPFNNPQKSFLCIEMSYHEDGMLVRKLPVVCIHITASRLGLGLEPWEPPGFKLGTKNFFGARPNIVIINNIPRYYYLDMLIWGLHVYLRQLLEDSCSYSISCISRLPEPTRTCRH